MILKAKGTGACFCGAVKYSFKADGLSLSVCHCHMCRTRHGSDYTTWVTVGEGAFSIDKGAALMTEYSVSEDATCHFCSNCGTQVYTLQFSCLPEYL